jgi:hypothetical protein
MARGGSPAPPCPGDPVSRSPQNVQVHGVCRCLVQDQGEGIESHHLLEPAGQLVEQRGQVAVRGDCFRHGEQRSVLITNGRHLNINLSTCHSVNSDP